MKFYPRIFLACLVSAGIGASLNVVTAGAQTAGRGAGAQAATSATQPDATMLQLMRGVLYPASNVVFAAQEDLAKYTPPADPSTSPNPITSTYGSWQAVENASLAIAEATKLISVSGRMCSSNRLAPVERADWQQFTEGLRQAALKSFRAAQTKSTDNMLEAAGDLSDACYMCHAVYREKPGGDKDRCLP